MTLSDLFTQLWRPVELADYDVYPIEYAPEVDDIVISVLHDKMGTVTAIGYPQCDGIERWYVEGKGWAAWLKLEELL